MSNVKDIISRTRCLVLDMDGTIYLGDNPIGDMINTLKLCREKGIRIYYFTNNSSKTPDEYVKKLSRIGFYDERDTVYTSAMATAGYLNANYKDKKVYAVATEAVKANLAEAGISLTEGEDADIVLLAYDTELTFEKIKKANELMVRGAVYVATHPDAVCPTPDIYMPDVGSFIKMFEVSSGRLPDVIIGKPNSLAGGEIIRATGLSANEITMVGDRLHTDIRFGINSGFNTILVLSGESTVETLASSPDTPSLVFPDLNEIVKYL